MQIEIHFYHQYAIGMIALVMPSVRETAIVMQDNYAMKMADALFSALIQAIAYIRTNTAISRF